MNVLLIASLVLYVVGVLSLTVNFVRALRSAQAQRAAPTGGANTGPRPSLDVVIPVKDERNHIAVCIESVLRQDYAATDSAKAEPCGSEGVPPGDANCGLDVLVVNDRSTDGTEEVVQRLQHNHANLRRVDIQELPPGFYGKPHALHRIASRLQAEYVAFVDSDLRLEPTCLGTLVDHLVRHQLDWLAVMGAPEVSRFWEKLLVPPFGAVIFAWYDPRKISDPNWPDAIGSAMMVCRRSAYEAIGGHGAVIDVYDEDSELVRIAKRAGQKVAFLLTPELFTQRHYGTIGRTIRGMTRTFVGGIKTIPRLLYTIGSLAFVSWAPFFMLALLAWATGGAWAAPYAPVWWAAAAVHCLVAFALAAFIYRTSGVNRGHALLHPLSAALLMWVCVRAILHKLRGESIVWRSTNYKEAPPAF